MAAVMICSDFGAPQNKVFPRAPAQQLLLGGGVAPLNGEVRLCKWNHQELGKELGRGQCQPRLAWGQLSTTTW